MRKALTAVLMMAITSLAFAAPILTWAWNDATNYEDGTVIPAGDLSSTLYCGSQQGGPWVISQQLATSSPSLEDMAFVVQNVPGTYYCVATHTSAQYGTESAFSNEVGFVVSPSELGKVPLPPVLISVT